MSMALMRLLLLLLVIGSWTSTAGACPESHDAQTLAPTKAQTSMPGPCIEILLRHELPICECVSAAAAVRTATGGSEKFVSPGDAAVVPPSFYRRPVHDRYDQALASVGLPPGNPLYLLTARLRL